MITYTNEDCMTGMARIPDKSIDLVLTDPPYNIGKAAWDKIPNYVEWCGKWFKECERVLKNNGSFYFWHNDMILIAQLMEWLRLNTSFQFKQMITWNKRFDGARNKGFLDGFIEVEHLRNYQKMCEYCLFYTNQENLSNWIGDNRAKHGLTMNDVDIALGRVRAKNPERGTELCRRWEEGSSIPSEQDFDKLCTLFGEKNKSYQDWLRECKDLRYTFNNQKTHHAVWNYEIAKKHGHVTPKPVELIENILKHSSNKGDTVLDCFTGSGTTAIACINTERNFIGFELDKDYFDKSTQRLEDFQRQPKLCEDYIYPALEQLGF